MHKERFARRAEIYYKEMWRLVKKEYKGSDIQEVGSSYKAVWLCLFVFVFVLVVLRPSEEIIYSLEMTQLLVEGWKLRTMLDTHGRGEVKIPSALHLMLHGTSVYKVISEDL